MTTPLTSLLCVALVATVASFARAHEGAREAISGTQAPKTAWITDVLAGLGNDAPTASTVAFLEAWARAENTQAAFNPLATTQQVEGSTMFNCLNPACTIGVQNFPDYE